VVLGGAYLNARKEQGAMKNDKRSWAKEWFARPKRHYINGDWRAPSDGKIWTATNPASGEVLCEYPIASDSDVNDAAHAARAAHRSGEWATMNRRERGRILREIGQVARDNIEELATLETLSNGKLYRESLEDDLPDCADIFDYYAGWTDKHYGEQVPVEHGFINYTSREPVGVCGLIVPWNFPLLLALWKIAPALAAGNTIIVKPSEYTPFSLVRWFELVAERVGLPAGVLNLLLGDGGTGRAMAHSMLIDKISFTGSTAVGRAVISGAAASNLKTVSLELGGKSPNIIFNDADLNACLERSWQVMFSQKGEKCSEPTRFIVDASLRDTVLERLKKRCEEVVCGDPFDSKSMQGAQCNVAQYSRICSYFQIAKDEGLELVCGGCPDRSGENTKGLFIRPTIYADVKPTSRLFQEEIFGPILTVTCFDSEEEAIALANNSSYGLAAGFWTTDVSRVHRVAGKLDAGMVFVNRYGCYDFASPFGGFKQSGWGKEMGVHSLEEYTKVKSVWVYYGKG
jgi:aldehyde dehydrogenase (NAD+)